MKQSLIEGIAIGVLVFVYQLTRGYSVSISMVSFITVAFVATFVCWFFNRRKK